MPKRKVVHVKPNKGDWKVQTEGTEKAANIFDNKQEAIARAKEIAKNAPLGQVKIHKEDGTIQTEHTYGKDPREYKG